MKQLSRCCSSPINYYINTKKGYCSYCFKEASPKNQFKWLFLLVFIMLLVFTSISIKNPVIKPLFNFTAIIADDNDVQLNDSCILAELVKQRCVLPNIAISQIRLETGNYTSDVCLNNKNLL